MVWTYWKNQARKNTENSLHSTTQEEAETEDVRLQDKQLSALWEMETGRTDCCRNSERRSHKMTKPRRRGRGRRRRRNNYGGSGCDNGEEEVISLETVKMTTDES